jgi:AcrR family transcriptional regulator
VPQNLSRGSDIYCKALDLALGMNKANLYHYCSSKEDPFYRVYLDYLGNHLNSITEEAEQLPDPRDRIAFVLRKLILLNATDKACR